MCFYTLCTMWLVGLVRLVAGTSTFLFQEIITIYYYIWNPYCLAFKGAVGSCRRAPCGRPHSLRAETQARHHDQIWGETSTSSLTSGVQSWTLVSQGFCTTVFSKNTYNCLIKSRTMLSMVATMFPTATMIKIAIKLFDLYSWKCLKLYAYLLVIH